MTQEELYWYEKRLYMQADAKEREIRDKYNHYIRGVDVLGERKTEEQKRREKMDLELKCREEVELARLTILEPILDAQQKARLKSIKEWKAQRERMERERWERERREEERRDQERKRREEEEKRLAPIRAKQEAERKRKEEQERIIREEKARREREEQEEKERTRRALGWFFGIIAVVGIIAAIIIFRKFILAAIFVVIIISVLVSN